MQTVVQPGPGLGARLPRQPGRGTDDVRFLNRAQSKDEMYLQDSQYYKAPRPEREASRAQSVTASVTEKNNGAIHCLAHLCCPLAILEETQLCEIFFCLPLGNGLLAPTFLHLFARRKIRPSRVWLRESQPGLKREGSAPLWLPYLYILCWPQLKADLLSHPVGQLATPCPPAGGAREPNREPRP